jgi:pseudouridine synthase
MTERLQKLLSQRGIASRRQAEKLIMAGRVTVNGNVAEVGQQADVTCDRICVDGVEIGAAPEYLYLLLHKPRGVVSTCDDPQGRKTVLDLLAPDLRKGLGLHPVGRLDTYSTGALLLTNDGDLTYQLTHPRHQMPKVYRVWVEGSPSAETLQKWRSGVMLQGRTTLPATVKVISCEEQKTLLEVTLKEGRNRQIRKVAEGLGHPVTALHRTKIGSLALETLPRGRYRLLTQKEVNQLKRAAMIPQVTPVNRHLADNTL